MSYLTELAKFIYSYCTDFIINIANILNLSYYEINFMIFCILYPLLILGSVWLYLIQKRRLKRRRAQINVLTK